jgi:hypothetical protein
MKTTVLWEKNAKKIVKTLWFLLDILGSVVYGTKSPSGVKTNGEQELQRISPMY